MFNFENETMCRTYMYSDINYPLCHIYSFNRSVDSVGWCTAFSLQTDALKDVSFNEHLRKINTAQVDNSSSIELTSIDSIWRIPMQKVLIYFNDRIVYCVLTNSTFALSKFTLMEICVNTLGISMGMSVQKS